MSQFRSDDESQSSDTSPSEVGQVSAQSAPVSRSRPRRVSRDRSRRFALGLVAVMTAASLLLGWGFSRLSQARPAIAQPAVLAQGGVNQDDDFPRTVDYVSERYQLGQRLYLENCATCHIGIPPQTLPSEAWRNLIQDSSHYGVEISPLNDPSLGLVWSYLRGFSRQKSNAEDRVPYRLSRSRYFKALHPDVPFPNGVSLESCATCHRAAQQFSFRPWENEPIANP